MPHHVLRACQIPPALLRHPRFKELYADAGLFYEHLTDTAGFIFRAENLEASVARHRLDPVLATTPNIRPPNYAHEFQRLLPLNAIYSKLHRPKQGTDPIICSNYALYRVWIRR